MGLGENWGSRARVAEVLARLVIFWDGVVATDEGTLGSLFEREVDAFRPGRGSDGIEGSMSVMEPRRLLFSCGLAGGRAGVMQGDQAYCFHCSTSKKSTGYSSFVSLLMKHFPSSGRRRKVLRKLKFTWAVRTLELRRTSSPFRKGPRMLTQCCGTPAYTTPAKRSGCWLTTCLVMRPPMLCAITVAPRSRAGTSGPLHGSSCRNARSL